LGIELTLYQARHSGPSIDRATKERDISEVKKRGSWNSWQSVGRYEKSAMLAATYQKLNESQKVFFSACERHLADIMLGRGVELALPEVAKASTLPTSSAAKVA